jgi:hypothetical protein
MDVSGPLPQYGCCTAREIAPVSIAKEAVGTRSQSGCFPPHEINPIFSLFQPVAHHKFTNVKKLGSNDGKF